MMQQSFGGAVRSLLMRTLAIVLLVVAVATTWVMWPAVDFLYRERSLAEAVRKYSETPGLLMTADDDVRSYLVKLAQHHKLEMSEGDVEIDYQDSPEAFGVPTRIGYTLSVRMDFRGVRTVPLLAQRSFEVSGKKAE